MADIWNPPRTPVRKAKKPRKTAKTKPESSSDKDQASTSESSRNLPQPEHAQYTFDIGRMSDDFAHPGKFALVFNLIVIVADLFWEGGNDVQMPNY